MNFLKIKFCFQNTRIHTIGIRRGLGNQTFFNDFIKTRTGDKCKSNIQVPFGSHIRLNMQRCPFDQSSDEDDLDQHDKTKKYSMEKKNHDKRIYGNEGTLKREEIYGNIPTDGATVQGDDIVLVTGGAGFLGQHVIKLLQEKAPHVKEIRVLDQKPYRKRIRYQNNKEIRPIIGSVTDCDTVEMACQSVNSVYHIAGLVSYGTFPDMEGMKMVNEIGTKNVVNGCIRHGVERLVLCSTVDVVIGFNDIMNGDECSTTTPQTFIMPGYPETKHKAECMVLEANGIQTNTGTTLNTISLRCNVLYGEEDPYYVTSGLKSAFNNDKVLVQIGSGRKLFQQCYVGNAAWAFLCADTALKENRSVGGQAYFIPDDTPVQNTFKFIENFLTPRGYRLSTYYIPSCMIYYPLWLIELILHAIEPWWRKNLTITSGNVKYINMNLYFNGAKSRKELKYLPLYNPEEAIERSNNYYKYLTFQ